MSLMDTQRDMMKQSLAKMLASGEITQAQYDDGMRQFEDNAAKPSLADTVVPIAGGVLAGIATMNPGVGLAAYGGLKAANEGLKGLNTPAAGSGAGTGGSGVNTPPGYQVNESAWKAPQNLYGAPDPELADRLVQLRTMLAGATDATSRNSIQAAIDKITTEQSQGDAKQFVKDAATSGVREAPGMTPTKLDFSEAKPLEDREQGSADLAKGQIDELLSHRSGAGQGELIDQYKRDMAGGQPSLAEAQLRQSQDDAMRQSLSVAASARGGSGNQLAAQLAALQAGGDANQRTNQSSAILRAQEYATAREGLGGVLNQQRTGGIQESTTAGTMTGKLRDQDIVALQAKYKQAVDQGLITSQEAIAQMEAELKQNGLNDDMVKYYTDAYVKSQNRTQDIGIDLEKTKGNLAIGREANTLTQEQIDAKAKAASDERTDRNVNAVVQGVATGGQTLVQSLNKGGVQVPPGGAPVVAPSPASGASSGQGAYDAGAAPMPYTPPAPEVDPLDPGY